jgi:hypothetical protein
VLDAADYGATWDAAAALLRNAVPRAGWERAARGTRGALGAVQQREVAGAQFTRTLPGAPDGEYVVIQYRTRFEHKAAAVETVTPMRDADGQWRVLGLLHPLSFGLSHPPSPPAAARLAGRRPAPN